MKGNGPVCRSFGTCDDALVVGLLLKDKQRAANTQHDRDEVDKKLRRLSFLASCKDLIDLSIYHLKSLHILTSKLGDIDISVPTHIEIVANHPPPPSEPPMSPPLLTPTSTSAFTHLPPHLPLIITSTIFFFLIDHFSLGFGGWVWPRQVGGLSKKEKRVWRSRAVGEFSFRVRGTLFFFSFSLSLSLSLFLSLFLEKERFVRDIETFCFFYFFVFSSFSFILSSSSPSSPSSPSSLSRETFLILIIKPNPS